MGGPPDLSWGSGPQTESQNPNRSKRYDRIQYAWYACDSSHGIFRTDVSDESYLRVMRTSRYVARAEGGCVCHRSQITRQLD